MCSELRSAAISAWLTASHPNSEVKQVRAGVVLRWGTTREGPVLRFFFLSVSERPFLFLFSSQPRRPSQERRRRGYSYNIDTTRTKPREVTHLDADKTPRSHTPGHPMGTPYFSRVPKNMSVLVRNAWHTHLYAPLTLFPALWADQHGRDRMVDRVPRCGPAGGSPAVRDAGHVCRTHAHA